MKVRVLDQAQWSDSVSQALARAKSYRGRQPQREFFADCLIVYAGDVATIIPVPTSQCVPVKLPNPIPYRGVSIGVVGEATTEPSTCVVTSSGEVLAREAQTIDADGGISFCTPAYGDGEEVWNGDDYVYMFYKQWSPQQIRLDHKLNFDVPQDCVYPLTPTPPDHPDSNNTENPPSAATIDQWNADWAAGQAALKLRRRNWFKKNHDSVLAQLAAGGGLALPVAWDYAIKCGAPVSTHTYRPIVASVAYADSTVSDTRGSNGSGTVVVQRVTTVNYRIPVVQSDGTSVTEQREEVITGTQTQRWQRHTTADIGTPTPLSEHITLENWYEPTAFNTAGSLAEMPLMFHQLVNDKKTASRGTKLFWSGEVEYQSFFRPDSSFGAPAYTVGFDGAYTPPIPAYLNTLRATVPEFMLTYRQDVPIKYDATGALASTDWNDSALQDGQSVSVIVFGPQGKGMFGEWDEGDTSAEVFGTATYQYDAGYFTLSGWTPAEPAAGKNLVPVSSAPTSNAIVKYNGLVWADVIAGARADNAQLRAPTSPAQQFTAAILAAAKAAP